jgi:hypothetical protein
VIEPNSKHPIPFEIKSEDLQYHTLHINNDHLTIPELKRIPIEDFFPDYIGKNQDSDCSFPQRTVLAERTSLAGEEEILHSPLDMHIPFLYEKIKINKEFYDLYTNLKWSDFEDSSKNSLKNEFRIEKYLEELILLIQAKVLLNNGDLSETEIYWFYPSSMTIAKKNKLKKIWNKLFNKYISQDPKNLVLLSESIAPFYYYKNTSKSLLPYLCAMNEFIFLLAALFSVLNPIGTVPIFVALTQDYTKRERSKVSLWTAINVFLILIISYFVGEYVLTFFGITIPALRIAGGIIIASSGFGLLNGKFSRNKGLDKKAEEEEIKNIES